MARKLSCPTHYPRNYEKLSANIHGDSWDSPTLFRLSIGMEEYELPLTVMTHGRPG